MTSYTKDLFVPEEKDKGVRMTQSVKPKRTSVKELKVKIHQRASRNLQDLKTVCVDDWTKIPPEPCETLASPCLEASPASIKHISVSVFNTFAHYVLGCYDVFMCVV